MSADNKSIAELAIVHTASLGIMGGVGTALNNPRESVNPYGAIMRHVNQGAKFLAQYIYNVFFYGPASSFFSMKDALIIAAAKILTRPIASKLYDKAKFIQNGLDAQQMLEEAQGVASNFRRIDEAHRHTT